MLKTIQAFVFTVLGFCAVQAYGQGSVIIGQDNNPITTGVPFLSISPDARSGAMGDVGAATSPDANATHWNPAKLAFLENDLGFSVSYTPWLSKIVNDMSLSYLSGYKKINQEQALALSIRYFDLGDIQLTDNNGQLLNLVSPREFSVGGTFSMKLSDYLSAAITGRFIHSNLLAGATSGSTTADARAGISGAADIAVFYSRDAVVNGNDANIAFGANISNIGAKITYLDANSADFLPTNLKLGTAYTTSLDPFNKLTFALDVNKLLVPTLPDSAAGLLQGMVKSFTDAPGGLREELQEVMVSLGAEYWYNNLFAVRAGYFYENRFKGNRKYLTAGLGLRYEVFGVDFAYLFAGQAHPLQETLRVSLHFNFNTKRQDSLLDTEEN